MDSLHAEWLLDKTSIEQLKLHHLNKVKEIIAQIEQGYLHSAIAITDQAKQARTHLSHAGISEHSADPEDRTTYEVLSGQIIAAVKTGYIKQARGEFENLKTAHVSSPLDDRAIRKCFELGGLDAAVLDPAGKKTAVEMEAEIAQAIKNAHIKAARHWFALMVQSNEPYYMQHVESHLKTAGADAAALDPDGKKTTAEMVDELKAVHRAALEQKGTIGAVQGGRGHGGNARQMRLGLDSDGQT